MEQLFVSTIQLTPKQAEKWMKEYYPSHLDYNCPVEKRSPTNPDFVKKKKWEGQSDILFNFLTAPAGTEFVVRREYKTKSVGFTEVWIMKNPEIKLVGYRDETSDHIDLLITFLNARSFGWFKHKKPLQIKNSKEKL